MSSANQKFRKLVMSIGKCKQLLLDSKNCVICHELLAEDKVVHHDHTTGYLLGVAHNACNLKVRTQSFTPILFHNLSRYDSHHLIKNLNLKLTVVPCTDENYLSFSLHVPVGEYMTKEGTMKTKYEEMIFLDSFRFLPESLDSLFRSLTDADFNVLRKYFPDKNKNLLLKEKAIYPYFYTDSPQRNCLVLDQNGLTSFFEKLMSAKKMFGRQTKFGKRSNVKTSATITTYI